MIRNKDSLLIPFPDGNNRGRRLDSDVHLPTQVEMVDERPVLVGNPEPVVPEHQRLRIQGNPGTSVAGAPEAVTGEFRRWEIREAGERQGSGRVEARNRIAGRVGEEDSVKVVEFEVGRGGGGGECGREGDLEFVHTRLVCGCALGVPGENVNDY